MFVLMRLTQKLKHPQANFFLSKVSAKDIQSGEKDYNTAYTVILKDNNKSLKQRVNIVVTGNGNARFEMLNEDGKAFTSIDTTSGTKMILRMKASEADTILKSISVQRHNDATDLNDLITLDSYTTLFLEGETVNFIADDAVESVVLKYGSTTQEIPLEVTGDSERMGSFVMPASDVTLVYEGTNCSHEYSDNGFCEKCGVYEPATLNENGVYKISNACQLYWFGALVMGYHRNAQFHEQNGSANAVLTDDIVVNEGTINASSQNVRVWIPIGTEDNSYTGQFDGQGHTISGLYFKDSNADHVGLFGFVRGGTDIYNVGVVNSYLEGRNDVGGIVGYNSNSGVTVNRCFSEATVVGNVNVAGIAGFFYGGAIVDCYHAGSVTGNTHVASIRGKNVYEDRGEIRNCFNVGEVTGTDTKSVGGIRGDGGRVCQR